MEKLKIGVLGAGGIARRRVLPALAGHSEVEVVAVMDVAGADAIAREFSIPRYYSDESALLADPQVEAVYIASPVFLHHRHIGLAAEAGRAIFCEKPLGRNLAEAREIFQLCKKHGVPLMEGYMMNFHAGHRKIREMIRSGEIGRPVSMRAQLSCWYPEIPGAWRQDPSLGGGGALIDMATHCFSLLEYLTGDRINGVFSMTTNQVHHYRSEDSATTLLRFKSGYHATVDSFFCLRDEASLNRLEIYGDAGAILAEQTIGQDGGGRVSAIRLGRDAGYDAGQNRLEDPGYQQVLFEPENPYAAEFLYFRNCLMEGRDFEINGLAEAIHIAEVTEVAYHSWREKCFFEV